MSALAGHQACSCRPLAEEDLEQVLGIERYSYDYPWTPGVFRECLRVGYSMWGAFVETRLVGYCVMSVAVGEAHILNVCVDPDYRRRGIAWQLMLNMLDVAREHTADTMLLEVRPSNRSARELYQALGFRRVGVRTGYYPGRNGREDAWILALPV